MHELALGLDPPSSTSDTLRQLDALQKCLNAVECWFQTWEQMSPTQFLGLTFNIFTQKIQNIVALFRLSTVDSIAGWNTAETRKKLDVLALLERIAVQMETVTAAVSVAEDDPREDSSKCLKLHCYSSQLQLCHVSQKQLVLADKFYHSLEKSSHLDATYQTRPQGRVQGRCTVQVFPPSHVSPLCLKEEQLPQALTHPEALAFLFSKKQRLRELTMGLQIMDGLGAEQASGVQVVPEGDIPPQELQDHFMPNFLDEPWLSSIFAWDSMNF